MPNPKILIASRQAPEVEAMLDDAPPEIEIHLLPPGEQLADHLSNIEIIYGGIGEADFPKAESLQWVHQPHAGVEGFMFPAFKASDVVLTNCRRLYGQQISEHAFALLLSLTRSIPTQLEFMKRQALGTCAVYRIGRDDNGNLRTWRHRSCSCRAGKSV